MRACLVRSTGARTAFIVLVAVNAGLALLSAIGKAIVSLDPRLMDSPWADLAGMALLGFVLTWPCVLIAGAAHATTKRRFGDGPLDVRYCSACNYLLTGPPEERCPKCGCPVDPVDVGDPGSGLPHQADWVPAALWVWIVISGCGCTGFVLGMLRFIFPVLGSIVAGVTAGP